MYKLNILFHNFFLSLLLLIRCVLSLVQAFVFLNNTEFKIFGRQAVRSSIPGGDQIFFNSVLF